MTNKTKLPNKPPVVSTGGTYLAKDGEVKQTRQPKDFNKLREEAEAIKPPPSKKAPPKSAKDDKEKA